ncbi:MAG: FAD-binding protein [Chloroflexi bacterium]|nr:FAD-binding protein [Chloroflexota bacterium]
MNGTSLRSATELQDFVRDNERVHAVGRASKPALHGHARDAAIADLSALSGIVEYQPSEYTVTVRAGAPVAEVAAALAERGQYLPFDPLLPDCASIGGTVAANLSGSRRYRYGGVRDFILGASVVDGEGRAFRVGGKVVKNAAGFDLSKFLVGSLGQYAIMTELTFKVFPDVPQFCSLHFRFAQLDAALAAIAFISGSVFVLDALDLLPSSPTNRGGWALLARLGGFAETLPRRAKRFVASAQRETAPLETLELEEQNGLWNPLAGLNGAAVVKVALSPGQVPALDAAISGMGRRYSVAGNVAWLATDDLALLDRVLRDLSLSGLCLLGAADRPVIGAPLERELSARVKQVLDPEQKLV